MTNPRARTVLVTGASSGIGRATATRLAGAGWRVHAAVRDLDAHREWAAATGITLVHLDVRDPVGMVAAVGAVLDASGGHLDGLVNNAGVPGVGPVEFVTDEAWAEVLDTNLIGQLRVTRASLPALRSARGGRVPDCPLHRFRSLDQVRNATPSNRRPTAARAPPTEGCHRHSGST